MLYGFLCGVRQLEWASLVSNMVQYKHGGSRTHVIPDNASCVIIMVIMHSHHDGHDVVVAGLMVTNVVFLILSPHVR